MKVLGSAFFFGNQAEAANAQFIPFFQSLAALPPDNQWPPQRPFINGYPYRRRLFLNELNDAWCGVVLSGRATEFHHYVQQVGNVVNVVTQHVGPNPPVEVNFFCIRKDSYKGIYSNYYGSYAFNGFLNDVWGAYRHFVHQTRATHVAGLQAQNPDLDEDDIYEAELPYSLRGKAKYAPLYTPTAFENLIQQLNQVEEVRMTTYNIDAADDRPVGHRINNIHKVYRLEEGQQGMDRRLFNWILRKKRSATRLLKSGRTSFSGSVIGKTSDGSELTIPFAHSLEDHLNFDYDEIGNFNVANLAQNPCLVQMLLKVRGAVLFTP